MRDLGRRKNIELRMFVYVSASQKFSFCSYHDHHNYDDDHHNYDDDDDHHHNYHHYHTTKQTGGDI